jgi:hypothetical protein
VTDDALELRLFGRAGVDQKVAEVEAPEGRAGWWRSDASHSQFRQVSITLSDK